jgi:hypothetical protein
MKVNALIALLIIIIAVFGCAKKVSPTVAVFPFNLESIEVPIDSMPETSNPRCHIEGPVVMRLQDAVGYVDYRESVGLWYISYVEPLPPGAGTDTVYNGFVCNMPNEYKKKGLKVRFSGQYYHAWKYIPRTHAEEVRLYLFLKHIQTGS